MSSVCCLPHRSTTQSALFSSLPEGVSLELPTQELTTADSSRQGHDGGGSDSGDGRGKLAALNPRTHIQYKRENQPCGPKVIKLLIKRPVLDEALQDVKKPLLYSLMSPAKQAKRDRRDRRDRIDDGRTKAVHDTEDGSTTEQLYDTARTTSEREENLRPCARRSESIYNLQKPTDDEHPTGREQVIPRAGISCIQKPLPDNVSPQRQGKYKSPKSKSPTRKRRKKRQHQRSIFSRLGRSKNVREPEYPPGQGVFLKTSDTKQQTSTRYERHTLAKARSKAQMSVSERCSSSRNPKSHGSCALQSPVPTESATRELKSLIRQVECENRARRSVSPRRSKTFVMVIRKPSCQKLTRANSSDPRPHAVQPRNSLHRTPQVPDKTRVPSSRRSGQRPVLAGVGPRQAPSGHHSRSDDTSYCTKSMSMSVPSRVGSTLSKGRSSTRSPGRRKPSDVSSGDAKTKREAFNTEQHRAFIEAPVCSTIKLRSPLSLNQLRGYHTKQSTKTNRGSSVQMNHPKQSTISNRTSSGERISPRMNAKRSSFHRFRKIEDHVPVSPQHKSQWPRQGYQTMMPTSNPYKAHPRQTRRQSPEVKLQNSASDSLSSHFSGLGCIDPSDSTTTRNVANRGVALQKSRPAGKKGNGKAQPIEGYILHSKTPIANTLLLCRSGITTTYENWTTEGALGPGTVRACSKLSTSNNFPSLSSYLDFLERKTEVHHSSPPRRQECAHTQPAQNKVGALPVSQVFSCSEELMNSFQPTSQAIAKKPCFEMRLETKLYDLKTSPVKRTSKVQAADKLGTSLAASEKPVTCAKKNTFSPRKESPIASSIKKESEEKNEPLKTSPAAKRSPVAKKDNKGRSFRPKLRFKYLPLTKQPLPFSSPTKSKKVSGRDGKDQKGAKLLVASETVTSRSQNGTANQEDGKRQQTCTARSQPKRPVHSKQEPLKQQEKCMDNAAIAKPVVVNLRKFSRQPPFNHVLQKSKEAKRTASPEKPRQLPPQDISPGETSASPDLQSMLEMAKEVLKKSKNHITRKKNSEKCVTKGVYQEPKTDPVKTEEQTSGSSHCHRSPAGVQDNEKVKSCTREDRSYTHLYKTKESRGLKPWRTTKAFTNRLKLMLQKNKEHCMNRKTEKFSKPKENVKPKKAYVVHRAASQKSPLRSKLVEDCEVNTKNAKTSYVPPNEVVSKTSPGRGKKSRARKVRTSPETGPKHSSIKPPMLRTEALAKKRNTFVGNKQPVSITTQTRKKKVKCKGTPLRLTASQLCKESEEDRGDELKVHSAVTQYGIGSQGTGSKSSGSMSDFLKRRLPLVGMDPAQVAKLNQEVFKADLHQKRQSSTGIGAVSRENQVQSELCVLLSKMRTRASDNAVHLNQGDIEIEGHTHCRREAVAELQFEVKNARGGHVGCEFHQNVAVSSPPLWKFSGEPGHRTELQNALPSETLLVHSELDLEPSTSALRSLLQCACNKIHSMPHLPGFQSQAPAALETEGENWPEDTCTKICSDVSSTEHNLASTNPLLKFCKPNTIKDLSRSCKSDELLEVEDTSSTLRTPKSKKVAGVHAPEESLERTTMRKRNSKQRKQHAVKASPSPGVLKDLAGETKKMSASQTSVSRMRPPELQKPKRPLNLLVHGSVSNSNESSSVDASQYKKVRMTMTSPELPSREAESGKPSREMKRESKKIKHSRGATDLMRTEKSTDTKQISHLLRVGKTRAEIGSREGVNRKSNESLNSSRSLFGAAETASRASTVLAQVEAGYGVSPRSTVELVSEVTQISHPAELGKEAATGVDKNPQDNSLRSISLVTSSTLNIPESSDHEVVVFSDSMHDVDPPFSRRSTDISHGTLAEKGAASTSGYGTNEASFSPIVSHRASAISQGFNSFSNAFVEPSRREMSLANRQTSPDSKRGTRFPSSNQWDSPTARQVGARKALSHISEERSSSDSDLERKNVGKSKRERFVSDRNVGKFYRGDEHETGNGRQVLPVVLSPGQSLETPEELATKICNEPDIRDSIGRANLADDPVATDARADNRTDALVSRTRLTSPHSTQQSPGRWFKSRSPEVDYKTVQELDQSVQRNVKSSKNRSGIDLKGAQEDLKQETVELPSKRRLNQIPVTVIYTSQTSEIPDLSLTIEDEFSLESWTQTSGCHGNNSMHCGKYAGDNLKNQSDSTQHTTIEKCNAHGFITEVHFPGELNKAVPNNTHFPSDEIAGVGENDQSNSNDLLDFSKPTSDSGLPSCGVQGESQDQSIENKDLESLLDTALGKNFVFPKSRLRKARNRCVYRQTLGCSRDISHDQDNVFSNSRESHGQELPLAPCSDTQSKFKVDKVALRAKAKQNLLNECGTCSLKINEDSSPPQHGQSGDREEGDEQTLQDILREVPTASFGLTRNRKSRKGEVREEDYKGIKHQNVHPPERERKEIVELSETTTMETNGAKLTHACTNNEWSDQGPATLIPSMETRRGFEPAVILKQINLNESKQDQAPSNDKDVHFSNTTINNSSSSNTGGLEYREGAGHPPVNNVSEPGRRTSLIHNSVLSDGMTKVGTQDRLDEVRRNEKGNDHHSFNETTGTNQNSDGAGDPSPSQVTLVADKLDTFSPKKSRPLGDQAMVTSGGAGHHESPCASSCSSIILSWVGSHQGSDVEDLISACLDTRIDSDNISLAAGSAYTNIDGPNKDARFLFENFGYRDKSEEQHRFSSEIMPLQSSEDIVNNGSKRFMDFRQNDVNENKAKSGTGLDSCFSRAVDDSRIALFYDGSSCCDDDDFTDPLSSSLCGYQDKGGDDEKSFLAEITNNKHGDQILDQESYLHNLVNNRGWSEELPGGDWRVSDRTIPLDTDQTTSQLLSERHAHGDGHARCGYVMSAWTNQRLHGDVAHSPSRPSTSNQRGPIHTNQQPFGSSLTNIKPYKAARSQDLGLLGSKYWNSGETRAKQTDCGTKPNKIIEHFCTPTGHGDARSFNFWVKRQAQQKSISESRPRDMNTRHMGLELSNLPNARSCEPGSLASGVGKVRVAPSLEEHLRLRFGSPDIPSHQPMSRPGSDTREGPLRPSDTRLGTRSEGARVSPGDKSLSSHASLNWYQPHSRSSSNSVNASQAPEALRPHVYPHAHVDNGVGVQTSSPHHVTVTTGDRTGQETGTLVPQLQPESTDRRDGHQAPRTSTQGRREDSRKVSKIVQMFEMKTSTT